MATKPSPITFPYRIQPGMKDGYVKVQKNLEELSRLFLVPKHEGDVPVWDVDRHKFVPGEVSGGGDGASFEIKLFGDGLPNLVASPRITIAIPKDLDGQELVNVELYVTTPSSSGKPTVQLFNATTGHNMLTVPVTVDVGEKNSRYASVAVDIDSAHSIVSWADEIDVNVTVPGAGSQGMGIIFTFGIPSLGGGGGGTGECCHYTHTQTALSATWVVMHNLGVNPSVTVVDTGESVILPNVHYDNLNQLTLYFGAPTSGKAYIN